jgi:hypothetical protein
MDTALTAHFCQNYFDNAKNNDCSTNVEFIRSLFGLATGAILAAGHSFKQIKEELGKEFADWLHSNEFVKNDANKLIKLFDYFGDNLDALSEVCPLQLLRLLAPNQRASRAVLADLIVRCGDSAISSADIDSIQREHKIKPIPKIKPLTPQLSEYANIEIDSNVNVGMIGNQQGGVGIFRLEVKDYQLANQLDTEWKESGFTANQWMRFMSSSARAVQDISQIVLGRAIANESELDELIVTLKGSKLGVQSKDIISSLSQTDVGRGIDVLPTAVANCLNKIKDLDRQIASSSESFGTDAMNRRFCREDCSSVITQLKMLAVEHELDFEALLLTVIDSTRIALYC